jgi:hypothetical protein
MGFLVPILRVEFEFPHVLYQGLTIFLVAIGIPLYIQIAKVVMRKFPAV